MFSRLNPQHTQLKLHSLGAPLGAQPQTHLPAHLPCKAALCTAPSTHHQQKRLFPGLLLCLARTTQHTWYGWGWDLVPALARQLLHLQGPNHSFFPPLPRRKAALGLLIWCKMKDQPFLFSLFLHAQVTNHKYTAESSQPCKGGQAQQRCCWIFWCPHRAPGPPRPHHG